MAKVVYVAVAPDGTKFIRTSNHHYTHAALACDPAGRWQLIGFCGSQAGAQFRIHEVKERWSGLMDIRQHKFTSVAVNTKPPRN